MTDRAYSSVVKILSLTKSWCRIIPWDWELQGAKSSLSSLSDYAFCFPSFCVYKMIWEPICSCYNTTVFTLHSYSLVNHFLAQFQKIYLRLIWSCLRNTFIAIIFLRKWGNATVLSWKVYLAWHLQRLFIFISIRTIIFIRIPTSPHNTAGCSCRIREVSYWRTKSI
jgi:hypothetical protein